jgi:hypothetical protein
MPAWLISILHFENNNLARTKQKRPDLLVHQLGANLLEPVSIRAFSSGVIYRLPLFNVLGNLK